MFSRNGAMIFNYKFIYLFAKLPYDFRSIGTRKIHQRNNMEISIPRMPGQGENQIILAQNSFEFRKKFRQELRTNNNVVNKRSGSFAFHMLAQKRKSFPPNIPIFIGFCLTFGDMDFQFKIFYFF